MKASVSSTCSSKRVPPKRRPCPDVNLEELKERLHGYVEKIGAKEAFNLYAYNNLAVSRAVDGYSLLKKEQLVMILLQVSPLAMIKFSILRDACKHLEATFGKELFSCFNVSASLLAGKVADQLFVLLAHIRRVMGNEDRWFEALGKYSSNDVAGLKNLREFMVDHGFEVKGAATQDSSNTAITPVKLRQLGKQISDVSIDSYGFPKVPKIGNASPLADPEVRNLFEESPLPIKKRPAAVSSHATIKKDKAPTAMKAKSHSTGDFKINIASLKVSGGKDQSYLQHVPKGSSKKQLIVSVSSKMDVNHRKLVDKIFLWLSKQKPSVALTKSMTVNYRNKLLGL